MILSRQENWKDVPGYEGLYQISDLGRFKSLKMIVRYYSDRYNQWILQSKPERVHGYTESWRQYQSCRVHIGGVTKTFRIHRLVATCFIPNPGNKREVNHINGNKLDNRVENLEWVTPSENIQHSFATGLNVSGENSCMAKITKEDALSIRKMRTDGHIYSTIGKKFGISESHARNIAIRRSWKYI